MQVLALVTQKGGTGKSSLAVSLAVAALERGLNVRLADLDPQGTARSWSERRGGTAPRAEAVGADALPAWLAEQRRRACALAVLDTPGVDGPAVNAAIAAADLCLVPARPSIADIEAAGPTIRRLSRAGRRFAFVLNQCPPGRSIRTSDTFGALAAMSAVADATLAIRADHLDALAQGLGVTEFDPAGKAAGEVRRLLDWSLARMGAQERAAA